MSRRVAAIAATVTDAAVIAVGGTEAGAIAVVEIGTETNEIVAETEIVDGVIVERTTPDSTSRRTVIPTIGVTDPGE